MAWVIRPLGCQAFLVSPPVALAADKASRRLAALARALQEARHPAFVDIVEAPASVAVHYRPAALPPEADPVAWLRQLLSGLRLNLRPRVPRKHRIPVCYAPAFALDLERVALMTGLNGEAVITAHAEREYTVSALGFLPGFGYLEAVPEALQVPRLAQPREMVAAGSVALAAGYTGIYPVASPGGWNVIGRTPVSLVCFEGAPAALLAPGDLVVFHAISEADYWAHLASKPS